MRSSRMHQVHGVAGARREQEQHTSFSVGSQQRIENQMNILHTYATDFTAAISFFSVATNDWFWQASFLVFYKLQPNADVRKTQLDAWCSLVVTWAKHKNISQIDVTEASTLPVFSNDSIKRSLPRDSINIVLEELAKRGNLEWTDKSKRRGYLFWRSAGEWGQQIYSWAVSNSKINTVCTIYELNQGDDTQSCEFHGLDTDILVKALQSLQMNGKAELMDFGDNQGVKFL
ncbi:unnamed protein product, partial [Meganyctiphanes norvegica]